MIDVNLGGTFHCSQAAARTMVAAGGGSIVNVASTSALAADPSRTAYCASKAGILGLTRAMALDLGPHGVRVNAVCPGLVRTPLTEPYFADQAFVDGLADVSPLGRAADPAEMADVVAFLAGDGARHVTGVALPVDGGFLAGKSWEPERRRGVRLAELRARRASPRRSAPRRPRPRPRRAAAGGRSAGRAAAGRAGRGRGSAGSRGRAGPSRRSSPAPAAPSAGSRAPAAAARRPPAGCPRSTAAPRARVDRNAARMVAGRPAVSNA